MPPGRVGNEKKGVVGNWGRLPGHAEANREKTYHSWKGWWWEDSDFD